MLMGRFGESRRIENINLIPSDTVCTSPISSPILAASSPVINLLSMALRVSESKSQL